MTPRLLSLCLILITPTSHAETIGQSPLWKTFTCPSKSTNWASIQLDEQNLDLTSTGQARRAMVDCLILGCHLIKVNGVAFYFPESCEDKTPFETKIDEMTSVATSGDLEKLLAANEGKVCFIWSGQHAEFRDVLAMGKLLESKKVPFFFGMNDKLVDKIRVRFL